MADWEGGDRPLRTERDVVASLAGSTLTLDEIYEACEAAGITGRDAGDDVIWGRNDTRWRRRARCALQALAASGQARRVGRARWVIEGTRDAPRWAVLVLPGGGVIALAVDEACALLEDLDDEVDLIVCDPPYGLDRAGDLNGPRRTYERDWSKVIGGYVDVDAGRYGTFMHAWVERAARVLRPGGQLVVVTATEQAWRVGHAAHDAGLGFVTQIAARRTFPMRLTTRPAFAHWVCSVYAAGGHRHPRRFFACPPELPKARSGRDYPTDVWEIAKYERPGLVRYDNALPPELVSLLVRAFSAGPDNVGEAWQDLVVDPFVGSGTTALVAAAHERRFVGGDVNPDAVRFTMARFDEPLPRRVPVPAAG